MKKPNFLLVAFLTFSITAYGQYEDQNYDEHKSDSHFRISVAIAHTFLPEETVEGTQNLILPSFGLCKVGSSLKGIQPVHSCSSCQPGTGIKPLPWRRWGTLPGIT